MIPFSMSGGLQPGITTDRRYSALLGTRGAPAESHLKRVSRVLGFRRWEHNLAT